MKLNILASVTVVLLCAAGVVSKESTNGLRPRAQEFDDEEYESASTTSDPSVPDDEKCGGDSVCIPTMAQRSVYLLDQCLQKKFPNGRTTKVTIMSSPTQVIEVFKITDPRDGDDFKAAKTSTLGSGRYPAVVIYIESEDEVKHAISCAMLSGYNISPKGRGHHYQGLSNNDGQVVLDMSLMCDPDEFEIEHEVDDWILKDKGQKRIGSIKAGAGCTNAVMLASTYYNFPGDEGGLYLIGQCPSVGIVGFSTGGGSGDMSPYIGWAADAVLEFDLIDYTGKELVANVDENPDLYWALRGGGSGLGVVTKMKTAVVASPEPDEGTRKFTTILFEYDTSTSRRLKKLLSSFQDFLYDADSDSYRFGGGAGFNDKSSNIAGIYLGSAQETVDLFKSSGLMSNTMLSNKTAYYSKGYEKDQSIVDYQFHGVEISEFDSYGESLLFRICTEFQRGPYLYSMVSSLDWCKDMGIDSDLCEGVTVEAPPLSDVQVSFPKNCLDKTVIEAMVKSFLDPKSFMNRCGWEAQWQVGGYTGWPMTMAGGYLLPKMKVDVLHKLASKTGIGITHLQHGAPMAKATNATAWYHRDTAILAEVHSVDALEQTFSILNEHYNDPTKIQGYYNYANPIGNPNWRTYYFGDNWKRIAKVKAKYDPMNVFGHQQQIEPDPEEVARLASATKESEDAPWKSWWAYN